MYHHTMTIKDWVKFTTARPGNDPDKPSFLDTYTIPKTDLLMREIDSKKQTVKIVDNKIMAFVDKYVKDRGWIPPPDKYSKIEDWKENPELKKKGIFLKGPRITST